MVCFQSILCGEASTNRLPGISPAGYASHTGYQYDSISRVAGHRELAPPSKFSKLGGFSNKVFITSGIQHPQCSTRDVLFGQFFWAEHRGKAHPGFDDTRPSARCLDYSVPDFVASSQIFLRNGDLSGRETCKSSIKPHLRAQLPAGETIFCITALGTLSVIYFSPLAPRQRFARLPRRLPTATPRCAQPSRSAPASSARSASRSVSRGR